MRNTPLEIRGMTGGHVVLAPLFGGVTQGADPTLYASCEMAAHRFAGATESDEPMVRIPALTLRRFVDELRALERDRRGTAALVSDQLRLQFRVIDRAGHIRLAAELTDFQPDGEHRVALAFQVDPTALPTILSDFEDLF